MEIDVKVEEFKGVRLILNYQMKKSNGETVATSKSSHCFVDKGGKLIILKRSFPELDKKLKAITDNN